MSAYSKEQFDDFLILGRFYAEGNQLRQDVKGNKSFNTDYISIANFNRNCDVNIVADILNGYKAEAGLE